MFAKTIIDSDAFVDMPLSTQALYFHLSMRADDDGFINNPKKIQRMIGASDDDLKVLIMKNFIIPFDSGVVVIKHWKIHNLVRKDRYKPTVYTEEKAELTTKQNGAYTHGLPDDTHRLTQYRLGEDRLDEDSITTTGSTGNLERGNEISQVFSYYLDHIDPAPSPICIEELKDFSQDLGADLIIRACQIAQDNKKATWAYIRSILKRYRASGIKTVADIDREEAERYARKGGKDGSGKIHVSDPDDARRRWGDFSGRVDGDDEGEGF